MPRLLSQDITEILAVWGAVLSTIAIAMNIIRAIRDARHNKPKLIVSCTDRLVGPFHDGMAHLIRITAVNPRKRPIVVVSMTIGLSNSERITQLGNTLGESFEQSRLEQGDLVEYSMDYNAIVAVLEDYRRESGSSVRLTKAIVRDSEGNEYTGKLTDTLKAL